MTAAARAHIIAGSLVTLAIKSQEEPGEALAGLAMALAGCMLSANMTPEKMHALLDKAVEAVKPVLAARGLLAS